MIGEEGREQEQAHIEGQPGSRGEGVLGFVPLLQRILTVEDCLGKGERHDTMCWHSLCLVYVDAQDSRQWLYSAFRRWH